MAKTPKKQNLNDDPVELEEPPQTDTGGGFEPPKGIWMRGLMMIILAMMFGLAQTILGVLAVVQFFWILFSKEKNQMLANFGLDLGEWLAMTARFQSAASEDKPSPWSKWGKG